MKTYAVTYNRKKNRGVYAISLVENPAMEEEFIALAKQEKEIKLKTINEEKRELIGVVLEPNKPIYRNQNNEEFNIVFSEDVIKELLIGFAENGNQNNSTIEHEEALKLDGVTFFENWIVEDEKNDKSNAYELNAKKGSWVTKLKIDDEDVWNAFVKTGVVKGFSIDAMVDLKEIKLNSNMSKVELNDASKSWIETQLDNLLNSLLPQKETVAKLEKEKPVELEEEKEVEKEEEIKQEEAVMPEEMKAEIRNMIKAVVSEMMGDKQEEMKKDEEEEVSMKSQIESLKKENDEIKAQLKEIGEQPASAPIKSQAEQDKVMLSKKDALIEFLNNR
jgi:hypothetical protein